MRRSSVGEVRMIGKSDSLCWSLEQHFGRRLIEPLRPIETVMDEPRVHGTEVVDDVAAADDQDTRVAQWRELAHRARVVVQRF